MQEVANLDLADLRLEATPTVRLRGKGGKERTCPLWSKTAQALRVWLALRRDLHAGAPVFISTRGQRITRSGIAFLLRRAIKRADLGPLRHAAHLTPHVFRNTTAMHLLQSRVDLTVIAAWLGHAQLSTTHAYVEINDRMKRQAVTAAARTLPELLEGTYPPRSLVDWLEGLGSSARYVEPPRRSSRREPPPPARST